STGAGAARRAALNRSNEAVDRPLPPGYAPLPAGWGGALPAFALGAHFRLRSRRARRRKARMFPSALLLALAGTLLFTVADDVPTLNVESRCRPPPILT